jgi:hypothetical protein
MWKRPPDRLAGFTNVAAVTHAVAGPRGDRVGITGDNDGYRHFAIQESS